MCACCMLANWGPNGISDVLVGCDMLADWVGYIDLRCSMSRLQHVGELGSWLDL